MPCCHIRTYFLYPIYVHRFQSSDYDSESEGCRKEEDAILLECSEKQKCHWDVASTKSVEQVVDQVVNVIIRHGFQCVKYCTTTNNSFRMNLVHPRLVDGHDQNDPGPGLDKCWDLVAFVFLE